MTRTIKIGSIHIGGGHPIALQSMCATKTTDVDATAKMCQTLHEAGAAIVRIAVDTSHDAAALAEIRKRTDANLSVDLQENYRLAEQVAPFVDKIRYNPGHLHHAEPDRSWQQKVETLVQIALEHDCALRIGVNCGSLGPWSVGASPPWRTDELAGEAPTLQENGWTGGRGAHPPEMLLSAMEHADFLDSLGFERFCVSLKGSDPKAVLHANREFARLRPEIPLHLGVTEAGLPPEGVFKTRLALEPLLSEGIGDTLRVSLTVPNDRKIEEILAGQEILRNVANGTIVCADEIQTSNQLNIVSCPSCARVQNEAFVQLAEQVREATAFAKDRPLKIAVMGCRVNGPGETDDADLGVWCGPNCVNLKRGETLVGSFSYEEIIPKLLKELRKLV